jgi:hypothetical protein
MGWFKRIPHKFMKIISIIAVFTFIMFLLDLYFTDRTDQPAKITGFVVNHIIPTEANWIVKAVNTITNSWLLLTVILVILWLFGYLTKRR